MKAGAKTNVVDASSSLIGRVTERAAIAEYFDQGTRLVTLTGPGGVGKTRLATRFAIDTTEAYGAHGGGGAWLVDLTDARSAMAICAVVAAALEIALDRDVSEARVVAELGRRLAHRRRVLLVLDNCDHLVREVGATLGAWLAAAPRAQFLVTSRVPLGLAGEQLWPVAGLAVPAADAPVAVALACEAVDLFVRRARQVRPDLAPTPHDVAAIVEIVRRLDGLPLAIELAAARTRVLSPSQLRDRLALGLLVRPGDGGRHASMRAVILDSVESLVAVVRDDFARCAIFRGGFTVAAAEAVLATSPDDVMASLEALRDHSLLRTTTAETGESRFQLYETIREVARELLATLPDRAALAAGHARYFAHLGRELAARAIVRADHAAFAELADELENLTEAHAHAIAERDQALALALV
ncbi:MAG: AAA family ATPase, partial [Proteobacteria bacterium]|nr:AAA family ATPase [Pseudomonadota bacterium]